MPTLTYDQAMILSRIKPHASCLNGLCLDYKCTDCSAYDGNKCQFIIPYEAGYAMGADQVRADIRTQFPPEQYPELHI